MNSRRMSRMGLGLSGGVRASVDTALDIVDPAFFVGWSSAEEDKSTTRGIETELDVRHFICAVWNVGNLERRLQSNIDFEPKFLRTLAFCNQQHIIEKKKVFQFCSAFFGVVIENFTLSNSSISIE